MDNCVIFLANCNAQKTSLHPGVWEVTTRLPWKPNKMVGDDVGWNLK